MVFMYETPLGWIWAQKNLERGYTNFIEPTASDEEVERTWEQYSKSFTWGMLLILLRKLNLQSKYDRVGKKYIFLSENRNLLSYTLFFIVFINGQGLERSIVQS